MSDDAPADPRDTLALAQHATLVAADIEIAHLRARILELEAAAAVTHGSLAQPTPDEAATIVHDVPPNAPR